MDTPKVTCIIPVRNGAATIERAIKSAFEAGCDFVLAFNDGSTDGSWSVMRDLQLEQWNAKDKAPHEVGVLHPSDSWAHEGVLRILSLDNPVYRGGVNLARNYLISESPYGLIIPLDADDTLNDITLLRDAWQPNTWVYGNHVEKHPDSGDVLVKGIPSGSLSRRNITGVTFLFHRDDWQRVGGYDPDFAFAEDYAMQCALTNAGVKPVYVDTVVYNRYMHPEGNERSALAGEYWTFYRTMARRKYPNVFAGMG